MSEIIERLRDVVSKARPGPWEHLRNGLFGGRMFSVVENVCDMHGTPEEVLNAEHIATFDPVLVGAMLDVIDAAEKLVDGDPDPEAVDGAWDTLAMQLQLFREVAA